MTARTGIIKDHQYSWPEAAIEMLKADWGRKSGSLICSELPRDINGNLPTRSAVCGEANRLGLAVAYGSRSERITPAQRNRGARAGGLVQKIKGRRGQLKRNGCWGEYDPTGPVFVAPQVEDVARISIIELTAFTCRWPVGNPGREGFGYCGNGVHGEGPYCIGHHARARDPRPRRPVSAPSSGKSTKTLADPHELFRQPA